MNKDNNIALSVINTKDSSSTIYRTEFCKLIVTLINETSDVINLQPEQTCLYIEIPGITTDELKSTIITADNWNIDIDDTIIGLTYIGTGQTQWTINGKIIVTIDGLITNAQPQTDNLQVNATGFNPKIPSQLFAPISISNPPKHGNANLHDVLQIKADNGGVIFISPVSENSKLDVLENELLLNIKNISDAPLYTKNRDKPLEKEPRIEVTFVYGSTIGCLTPCNEDEGGTYAWEIKAAVSYKTPEYGWVAHQPEHSGNNPCPKWIFQPESTNIGLIGAGSNANITLSFSQIIAVTPPGHTQVLLHFIDFMKNDTTPYDDALFVLDIVKKAPPASSGIIYFYSMNDKIDVYNPNTIQKIEFRWVMFNVAKIEINLDNTIHQYTKEYHTSSPLARDQMTIPLGFVTKDYIIATLTAYNVLGSILNKIQFTLSIRKFFFTDPRDDNTYNGIRIGTRIWMTQNLEYAHELSKKCKEVENGRLYSWESAQPPASSEGWKLPTPDDWEDLLKFCPASTTPYAWLIKGGESGFNAALGGYTQPGFPGNRSEGIVGRYWLNKEDGFNHSDTVSFNSIYSSVLHGNDLKMDKGSFVAVRYVKIIKE